MQTVNRWGLVFFFSPLFGDDGTQHHTLCTVITTAVLLVYFGIFFCLHSSSPWNDPWNDSHQLTSRGTNVETPSSVWCNAGHAFRYPRPCLYSRSLPLIRGLLAVVCCCCSLCYGGGGPGDLGLRPGPGARLSVRQSCVPKGDGPQEAGKCPMCSNLVV